MEKAKTGYPLVDASMKCFETGYLNFRMRAMLVSFLTHHLWQPWEEGVIFVNKFLDFEQAFITLSFKCKQVKLE